MRIGIRIPPCDRIDRVAEVAQQAEAVGFDSCWFPDSQLLWRDAFVTTTAAALATSEVGLGTAVTNVLTRHPSVLASAINSIVELDRARFCLGVGIGDSSVRTIDVRPASSSLLRARIDELRRILRGEDNEHGFHLRDAAGACPILIAATGPRNLALAGEIGDGVILLGGVNPAGLAASLEHVGQGAARAGARLSDRQVVIATYCCVTDDLLREARQLKPMCMTIAQQGGQEVLRRIGVDISPPAEPAWVYPDLVHAEDWAKAVEVCSEWVSDEMAARFGARACLFGSAQEITERIQHLGALGVTELILHHVGPYSMPNELIESLGPLLPVIHSNSRSEPQSDLGAALTGEERHD
jgi:5,10-methylenetetrahydromethanopterin reductase